MRRGLLRAVISALVLVLFPVASAASADAAAPYCGLTWGSMPKVVNHEGTAAAVSGLRTGQHACYDRVVLDLTGTRVSISATYDTTTILVPPERNPVLPLVQPGQGVLSIQTLNIIGSPWVGPLDTNGRGVADIANVTGYRTLRHVTNFGYGWSNGQVMQTTSIITRARLPYRVFLVNGPGAGSRVVIDIAHRW